MATKKAESSSVQRRIRFDPVAFEFAMTKAKEAKFQTLSKYIQWLIWKERTGTDGPTAQLEEKLAMAIGKVQEDVRDVRVSAEGANAFLHALAKMLLVTLHDPEGEEKTQLRATAGKRYERLLTVAGKELALLLEGEEPDAESR